MYVKLKLICANLRLGPLAYRHLAQRAVQVHVATKRRAVLFSGGDIAHRSAIPGAAPYRPGRVLTRHFVQHPTRSLYKLTVIFE